MAISSAPELEPEHDDSEDADPELPEFTDHRGAWIVLGLFILPALMLVLVELFRSAG